LGSVPDLNFWLERAKVRAKVPAKGIEPS